MWAQNRWAVLKQDARSSAESESGKELLDVWGERSN